MRFTAHQYDEAITALQDAKKQLEADGHDCSICGDSGHMAFECGNNPLLAMAMCHDIAEKSRDLHETLHQLGGFNSYMGVQLGPAKVIVPEPHQWFKVDRHWHEFPLHTIARQSWTGSTWTKTASGWQATGGDTFAYPGDSNEYRIPSTEDLGATKPPTLGEIVTALESLP